MAGRIGARAEDLEALVSFGAEGNVMDAEVSGGATPAPIERATRSL
jgi:hypothetical protein